MRHSPIPCLILPLLALPLTVPAQSWYVSPMGSDSNAGTSTASPFKTIQAASERTNPGDTVYLMAGTHNTSSWDPTFSLCWIWRSGNPAGYITYTNAPGAYPTVSTGSRRFAFNINASWIRIANLKIIGQRSTISLDEARSWQNTPWQNMPNDIYSRMNGGGIIATARDGQYPERLVIQNCEIIECGGSALSFTQADYVTVQSNTIYDNCQRTNQGGSAINLYDLQQKPGNTDVGSKYVIQNNKVFNNETLINWSERQAISDGNGIIVDYTNRYNGSIRIQNNLVFNNGGSGIAATKSNRVEIFGNTTWHNSRSGALDWANIMVTDSTNVWVRNNIISARSNKVLYKNTTTGFDYNLLYRDGASVWRIGANDVLGDPRFVSKPANDWDGGGNFDLQGNSPAKNRARQADLPTVDFWWRSRPYGGGCDIGAFETRN